VADCFGDLICELGVRAVTRVPGDQLIFEFGPQICIFDMTQKKIALLVKGRSPVVTFKETTK